MDNQQRTARLERVRSMSSRAVLMRNSSYVEEIRNSEWDDGCLNPLIIPETYGEDALETIKKAPKYPLVTRLTREACASFVVFLVTVMLYVSAGQSILGKQAPDLLFVPVSMMLMGSTLTGWILPLLSRVPWTATYCDVAFVPFIVGIAAACFEATETRVEAIASFAFGQALMFFVMGLAAFILGMRKATKMALYLPYVVVSGLLSAIGVSLMKAGLRVANGVGMTTQFVALVVALASRFTKTHLGLPGFVATPTMVVLGSVIAYFVTVFFLLGDNDANGLYLDAWTPESSAAASGFNFLLPTSSIDNQSGPLLKYIRFDAVWHARAPITAGACLGVIKTAIKCGSLAGMFPTADIEPDHEATASGITTFVPALFFAPGQSHSFPALKLMQQLGVEPNSKTAGIFLASWMALAWLYGPLLGLMLACIPSFVFGALLIELGLDYLHTFLIFPLLATRRRRAAIDSFDVVTLISVVATASVMGLLEAVAVGLAFSVVASTRRMAQLPVISSAEDIEPSIFHIKVSGFIFFGSAADLVDLVAKRAKQGNLRYVLLDLASCLPSFDLTAIAAFERIAALAVAADFAVLIYPARSPQAKILRQLVCLDRDPHGGGDHESDHDSHKPTEQSTAKQSVTARTGLVADKNQPEKSLQYADSELEDEISTRVLGFFENYLAALAFAHQRDPS